MLTRLLFPLTVALLVAGAAPAAHATTIAPRPVSLPADAAAHPTTNVEWWYFVGHLSDAAHHSYGFEVTFFRFSGLRRAFPGSGTDTAYRTDVAVTDEAAQRFYHTISYAPSQPPLTVSDATQLHLRAGTVALRTVGVQHYVFTGGLAGSVGRLSLDVASQRPAMLVHGGYLGWGQGWSYYYSLTHMAAHGTLTLGKRQIAVQGTAWNDHQWGDMQNGSVRGWDWMALTLNDGTDMSLINERTTTPQVAFSRWAMALLPDNRQRYVPDAQITARGHWRSPATGIVYPSGWRVRVPALALDVVVTPTVRDQEMSDSFVIMGYHSAYWEGSCTVVGTRAGHRVVGKAYTELTGYGALPPSTQLQ